ncbi:acyl carrier protein [Saccharopolyspora erythraea NRRL 2338]|uniref:Acyl carrier protein n=2 Tax=Saccharopolyspora erythraea TaxID=1836 RepID=A4FC69_SACEN|nr:phosphopantetheine-binding protein [Saccharopolyspora erythraea]EQD84487.1 acyl carrier protein [Saccharopolyspora erythraea D]PFG95405.1 acyl carrier protein [Saccharopolyspora erythraea NRRL 2338]QRK92044.1 acyl carrier protein [Saccharopolyspora erythraea]CAM01644.1 putative acyl carrier protein [Saccharopolyspora erythraea NRRL 2338]
MTTNPTTSADTFPVVADLLSTLVGDAEVLGTEITPETTFHEDLRMESVDLVTFAGILAEHFGDRVNLAEHLADKELDEVIALTVGDIAEYVAERIGS